MSREDVKCHVKGCSNDVEDGSDYLCVACSIEMEVLMKAEMGKRLGRAPSEAEFDILLTRVATRATERPRK